MNDLLIVPIIWNTKTYKMLFPNSFE